MEGHFPSVGKLLELLFSRDNRSIENIPPTKATLKWHILRTILQSSEWYQALHKLYDNCEPCVWGWQLVNDKLSP